MQLHLILRIFLSVFFSCLFFGCKNYIVVEKSAHTAFKSILQTDSSVCNYYAKLHVLKYKKNWQMASNTYIALAALNETITKPTNFTSLLESNWIGFKNEFKYMNNRNAGQDSFNYSKIVGSNIVYQNNTCISIEIDVFYNLANSFYKQKDYCVINKKTGNTIPWTFWSKDSTKSAKIVKNELFKYPFANLQVARMQLDEKLFYVSPIYYVTKKEIVFVYEPLQSVSNTNNLIKIPILITDFNPSK